MRTLDAYRNSITEGTTLILSPNSEFFRYLKQIVDPKSADLAAHRTTAVGIV